MKLVIQRVKNGKVSVEGEVVGQIENGLFVLFGVGKDDTKEKADALAQKLVKMRLMKDDQEKMNLTVSDVKGSFLVVSQFTLYADTSGGNRPSFLNAASPDDAKNLYDCFVEQLRILGQHVETGKFGHYMEIDVQLDGPVTILIEN